MMENTDPWVEQTWRLPPRLFERLRQIAGYSWDDSIPPFHTSYGNWHVHGTKNTASTSNPSEQRSPEEFHGGLYEDAAPSRTSESSNARLDGHNAEASQTRVIARISRHALREERAYHICKSLSSSVDPKGNHIAKPVELLRLPNQQGDTGPIIVSIFEYIGPNNLERYIDYGPAYYTDTKDGMINSLAYKQLEEISLPKFLDFAIGATECVELIHHGQRIVHGEIRGDAFHFSEDTGQVRLINFGSGLRSFENGLTSFGWSALSKEAGARTKLSYISPEQTGRMPAEPDSRTDIYSLGVLFWTLLSRQQAYGGRTPMDVIQGVLGRRLPSVCVMRIDIPNAIGIVIQKMTAKTVGDRYQSTSGLKHDLMQIRQYLGDGNSEELINWKTASKDVSSFFILPTVMVGRSSEHDEVVKIIDKVSRRRAVSRRQNVHSLSSGSSLSDGLPDLGDVIDRSDDGSSSAEGRGNFQRAALTSLSGTQGSAVQSMNFHVPSLRSSQQQGFSDYGDSLHALPTFKLSGKHTSLGNDASRSSTDCSSLNSQRAENDARQSSSDGIGSLTNHWNSEKFRRKGRCEVVSIAGAAGLGKSFLTQSVQVEARRRGYFASSKFDQSRKAPFGPVLKLLSSLFKQVFSETNTDTPFHHMLKQYVRPAWSLLHVVLGLPEFLLSSTPLPTRAHGTNISSSQNNSFRSDVRRRGSSPGSSRGSFLSGSLGSQHSQDFLRGGSSTKSTRMVSLFLDVLRVFSLHKFICFCLDDLQFADDESLELITQLVASKMELVIILTYRPTEILPERIRAIIEPPNAEGIRYLKTPGLGVTRIVLKPLSEEDIVQYVATTMCRPEDEIVPLAAVIQAKTAGNPFFMREMLDACHRKGCIWYDHKETKWQYDLDIIFKQFASEEYHTLLDGDFVTRRLTELPPASRSILAWASLIGGTFSFELIQKLLSGEFDFAEDAIRDTTETSYFLAYTEAEVIAGLQAAIQAYIVVATENDDRFRFAHDRYVQASSSLRECTSLKMHFIIAQTMLKYYLTDDKSLSITATHICEAVPMINARVKHRQMFRNVLLECAHAAAEAGARPTAANFYAHCLELLQKDHWNDDEEDVYYDETLQLYTRAAECYHYIGDYHEAMRLLESVLKHAKTPVEKAPLRVLQSRIYGESGDSASAFISLRESLLSLGIDVPDRTTYEECDVEFKKIAAKIKATDRKDLIVKGPDQDLHLAAVGSILVEIVSTAFWSDRLAFYQLVLVMVQTHLTRGGFPQSGLSFHHLAMIAVSRFNMLSFANDLGHYSLDLMKMYNDSYTLGRGLTIFSLFVGHLMYPLSVSFDQLETALLYTIEIGDRVSTILNFGVVAMLKFFGSENMGILESFCTYGCEEIPDWQRDCRGGTMLIAVRQVCRALQGKTKTSSPTEIISDESHNTQKYLDWVHTKMMDSDRPIVIYESLEIAPLFLYGHYDRAVQVAEACSLRLDTLWSARNIRFAIFFHGLSLAARVWSRELDPAIVLKSGEAKVEIARALKDLRQFRKDIVDWEAINNVNYLAWSCLLDAQISELEGGNDSLRFYENALDHASAHSFTFEEALGNYLLAGYFLRRGARRPAKAAFREAITLYRQFGAIGVARHIEAEHSLLLQGPTKNLRVADASAQTDFVGDNAPVTYRTLEGDEAQVSRTLITETKGDRIGAWQGGSARPEEGGGLPALDMLDLTSILESSQVISSILSIDQLLTTMCEIILSNCGGLASLVAIIVEEDDPPGWNIAASGDSEHGATAHIPGIPVKESAMVAESVILYCTRFRETVFLPDVVKDERFSNLTEAWSAGNPGGKSIIAMPIVHGQKPLLGVLYLAGEPNAFTDRNLTVLGLLVNQIGISYSNALTLKAIERVSASNVSMVLSQKESLAKAKIAEAEALRNLSLAEEAAKAKSIFLANVSHELRTPLNGVIGNSELLKYSDLRKDQADMADSIRVSADLLLTVINDILDFSKMEADKMELFIVCFNPLELLKEVVRSVAYSNRDKRNRDVQFLQDIQIPETLIYGDPVRLHQVLGNLVGNSIKFTEQGSITIGAKVDKETAKHVEITFWVKDTGIGIPPSQLAKLFRPFSQADASTARKYGGSGLGLSICKSLIESMMRGRISLESHESRGTTAWFTVTFPKADVDVHVGDILNGQTHRDQLHNEEVNPDQVINPYIDYSTIPRAELRVCIAEDNPINQKIAIQFVQKLGFINVDAFDNGLEAVEGLRAKAEKGEPYHLLLCDVQMPVCDGYEATKMIRRDPLHDVRGILIIAMTASAIQGDREKCLESGMNDYLAKPVRVPILRKKLDQYFQAQLSPLVNAQAEANSVAKEVLSAAITTQNGSVSALNNTRTGGVVSGKEGPNRRV